MEELDELLAYAVERNASDIHVKVGSPPVLRVDGRLTPTPFDPVTVEATTAAADDIVPASLRDDFATRGEVDFVYTVSGLARFRVSAFRQRGSVALAFRRVPAEVPVLEDLDLPPAVRELAHYPTGLVLITGPACSGKSATLAAMVDHLNQSTQKHILSIEDPIEVLHRDDQSIVSQREVGSDTQGFASAVQRALRQDPDVLVVGDIPDVETALGVLAAAAGDLVIASMVTTDAADTVTTLIDMFPPHLQRRARNSVIAVLRGIVSQHLLLRADGGGCVVAAEVLLGTSSALEAIAAAEEHMRFAEVIERGDYNGMRSLDERLVELVGHGVVSRDDALAHASSPETRREIEAAAEAVGGNTLSSKPREPAPSSSW